MHTTVVPHKLLLGAIPIPFEQEKSMVAQMLYAPEKVNPKTAESQRPTVWFCLDSNSENGYLISLSLSTRVINEEETQRNKIPVWHCTNRGHFVKTAEKSFQNKKKLALVLCVFFFSFLGTQGTKNKKDTTLEQWTSHEKIIPDLYHP